MKDLMKAGHSLELVAALAALCGALGVLQTFIIGQHFVIPTMSLFLTVIFGNLAWFAFHGKTWARYCLFWLAVLIAAHTFFALFWAKTPREMLGDLFLPLYGGAFLLFSFLAWQYQKANRLFGRKKEKGNR